MGVRASYAMAVFARPNEHVYAARNVVHHTAVSLQGLVQMSKVYAVQIWQHYALQKTALLEC